MEGIQRISSAAITSPSYDVEIDHTQPEEVRHARSN